MEKKTINNGDTGSSVRSKLNSMFTEIYAFIAALVIPSKLSDLSEDATHRTVTDTEKSTWNGKQAALGYTPENSANKGQVNGYAELDASGKVPSGQLPAYVDDVLEYANYAALPGTGSTGIIYVTLDDNKTYRWSGSAYVEISASLALGETSGTAYRGDRGKTAYDHSQTSHSPADAEKNVQPDWNQANDGADDYIKNKPSIPDQLSDLSNDSTHRTVTDTEKLTWNAKQAALGFTPENSANKGQANGYAELDSGGKVPSAQLPAYVDDVLEYANYAALPATGTTGIIYVTLDDNKTYRWSGSAYVEISVSLALGETSATAYRGDRGKMAYDHSQISHAPVDAEKNVQPDWNQADNGADDYIKNKPSSITDSGAIHKATANEISGITEKTSFADNDIILIEDSADSYNKKKVKKSNLGITGSGSVTDDIKAAASLYNYYNL